MNPTLAGTLAGLVATAPMTAFMELAHRHLPWHERQALPPRGITLRLVDKLHIEHHLNESRRKALAVTSHFAFGAAAGALFGPIGRRVKGSKVASGTVFGLTVWAVNYLGILPEFGLTKRSTEEPLHRTALMVGAHIVWGGVLGALSGWLTDRGPLLKSLSAPSSAMMGS